MPRKATSAHLDSQNQPSWSAEERPPLTLTSPAQTALFQEREEARTAWYRALLTIPTKPGARRTAALNKCMRLKDRYEALIGHLAGKPDDVKA